MEKCLLCHNQFNDSLQSSKEHIIPYAIGNRTLITYDICDICNNLLGRILDDELSNDPLVEIYRRKYSLSGQTNKYPKNFREGVVYDYDSGDKLSVQLDQNLDYRYTGKVIHDDGTLQFKGENALQDAQTHLKRNGYTQEEIGIIVENAIIKTHRLGDILRIETNAFKSLDKMKLAVAKIALEFSALKLGNYYLDDPQYETIRQALYDAIYLNQYDENLVDTISAIWEIDKDIKIEADKTSPFHCLAYGEQNGSLYLQICLFMNTLLTFYVPITASPISYSIPRQRFLVVAGDRISKSDVEKLLDKSPKHYHFELA